MLKIKVFPFNPFGMNTYLVFEPSGEAIIIDAGNNNNVEHRMLLDFIEKNQLMVTGIYLTHCHIDHVLGIKFLSDTFELGIHYHSAGQFLLDEAKSYAHSLGFDFAGIPSNMIPISETHIVSIGNSKGKVIYTPGHVEGSVCYYFAEEKMVFVGDVLFKQGVGRTDLPTGNYDQLERSIRQELYILPNETTVYSGHGPSTSIGFEKINNPFFQG